MSQEPQKITIHRALAQLKLIDSKIDSTLDRRLEAVGYINADNIVGGITKREDFEANAKANIQSVEDLIKNREALKQKIVRANNEKIVRIGSKEMSIIDAINYKDIIAVKKILLRRLINQRNTIEKAIEMRNARINEDALKLASQALQKDNIEINDKDVMAIVKPFKDANELSLCDPIGIYKYIEYLENEISEFETEVDAVLSEANATTYIEV